MSARTADDGPRPAVPAPRDSAPTSRIVRAGHYATLDYMSTPVFAEVKALFESEPEIGGVYFRPIDRRVTVLDLSATSPKPRVGVGADPYVKVGTTAAQVRPTVGERISHLRAVRARQRSVAEENCLEARLIREAQLDALRIPGFPDRLRFINSQWRLELHGERKYADLIAVDLLTGRLVLIELKREPDPSARAQVAEYVEWFDAHAPEVQPFFLRVAQVMGRLYGCEELVRLENLQAGCVGLVAWPGATGLHVQGLEALGHDGRVAKASPTASTLSGVRDLGPQSSGDNAFKRRMRRHQSWYRTSVLALPYGVGPNRNSTGRYGNMLTPNDGQRGANFLTQEIHEVMLERLALGEGVVEPYRLLHNMLGSQPMCFNLFGPQVRDTRLATLLWRAVLGDEVASVERVAIEWAPKPAEEYLADNTAFDAFVEYRRPDGQLAFVGIETKLTEPFSQRRDDGSKYRRWMTADAPWRPEAAGRVADIRHNQLWRDHLLAVATQRHPRSKYAAGRLMLVRHPGDTSCQTTVTAYRALLHEHDDTFVDMRLDHLVDAWRAVSPETARDWLDAFALRYLDLSKSEGA